MPTLPVYDVEKNQVGTIDLSEQVFGVRFRSALVHTIVTAQLARRRSGNACTKIKSEVRGAGRKPYRQKGTGRARRGSTRTPIAVGGGATFGPKPRSYAFSPPKKMWRAALAMAVSKRVQDGSCWVLSELPLPDGKTKSAVRILEKVFALRGALVVDRKENATLARAVRNVPHYRFLPPEGVNVLAVLRHPALVLTRETVSALETRLGAR